MKKIIKSILLLNAFLSSCGIEQITDDNNSFSYYNGKKFTSSLTFSLYNSEELETYRTRSRTGNRNYDEMLSWENSNLLLLCFPRITKNFNDFKYIDQFKEKQSDEETLFNYEIIANLKSYCCTKTDDSDKEDKYFTHDFKPFSTTRLALIFRPQHNCKYIKTKTNFNISLVWTYRLENEHEDYSKEIDLSSEQIKDSRVTSSEHMYEICWELNPNDITEWVNGADINYTTDFKSLSIVMKENNNTTIEILDCSL